LPQVGELEEMLDELERSLGPLDGDPAPLEGGITNRNFRARLGGEDYVVRMHGADTALLGIDRDAERLAGERAAELGIAPALVAAPAGGLVTRFVACVPLAAGELARRAGDVAQALRRFHDSGLALPTPFWVPDLLARYATVIRERGRAPSGELERATAIADRIGAALPLEHPRPCHDDLLPGNIICAEADAAVMIVDWEYAGMGHPLFDLGNLSVNNDFAADTDERLLTAYLGEPPSASQRSALALMRLMSDAREGAWGAVQEVISDLDFDFAGYARRHFQRLFEAVEHGPFEEWLASA
jgi:thiamine kinase-like enzyme